MAFIYVFQWHRTLFAPAIRLYLCMSQDSICSSIVNGLHNWVIILQTWACAWQSIGKSTNCEAVDWSTTTHVEKSRDLKNPDINRMVQLRRESYVSIARDWNFHGKYPISSLLSTSIKSKWRPEAPSCLSDYAERYIVTFLFRNRLT